MAMDPKIIKKTQDILGKVIKKPPLTEKLLGKPPFRFLHDVFMEVMKNHGTLKGLYSEAECNSANVTEKDAKLSFLQKTIDCLGFALGESLSVRPSKVVAGQEAHKTNELLQALGQVATKKIDTSDAVRKVLSGEKSVSKKSSKDKKENEAINEDANPKDKIKPGEDKNETEKNDKKVESSSKEQGNIKEPESERKRKKESSHSRDQEDKERKSSKAREADGKEIKKEGNSKDSEYSKSGSEVLVEQENTLKVKEKTAREKQGSSKDRKDGSHTEREKREHQRSSNEKEKRRENEQLETESDTKEKGGSSRDREKRKEKIDSESASKEKESSSRDREKRKEKEGRSKERDKIKGVDEKKDTKQKEGVTNIEQKTKPHEDDPEKVKNIDEVDGKKTKRDRRKKEIEENVDNEANKSKENITKDENARAMQRPASAKGPRVKQNQQDSGEDEDTSNSALPAEKNTESVQKPVQKLVRPSSARPAPPKVKKAEVVEEQNARVNSKPLAPVIMDNKNDDEDEGFIVEEDPALGNILDMNQSESNSDLVTTQEHGSLVRKMLESKKQADNQNNTDKHVVFDGARKKEREIAEKEIDGLRTSIQQLVRSAHPLGKIMDYIQEDIDSMQKELIMWRQENQKHELSLKAEQSITENEVEPLKLHLNELEHEIAEMMNNISAVKSNILRNEEKIEDLILGISR
ncbi:TRAF3-interacting protein 1 isoform X1 [Hydra vulgaris]|uniref:TRAF3-interacting protein 1 isoform X1 n=1 Tax=Hydra vulgaris TaxID=6087 RepID=UPI001F5E68C6|nr:TRAF3-interacting protein 1 isoform X1 [Hydra vulgaris]